MVCFSKHKVHFLKYNKTRKSKMTIVRNIKIIKNFINCVRVIIGNASPELCDLKITIILVRGLF